MEHGGIIKKDSCKWTGEAKGGGGAQKGLNWGYAKRRMNTPSYSMRHMFCGFCPREIRHCQIAGTNKHAFNLQLREHGMRRQRGCWEGSFVSIPEGDVIAPPMPGTIGIFCITMAADPRNIDSLMQEVLSTDTHSTGLPFFSKQEAYWLELSACIISQCSPQIKKKKNPHNKLDKTWTKLEARGVSFRLTIFVQGPEN